MGRKQLRGQQQKPRGRVRRGNQTSYKPKQVDARQKLRKNSMSIVKSESGISNGVKLYTSHFDARNKINAKKVDSSQYLPPSRGNARNALNDVQKSAKPNTNKRNWNLNKQQTASTKRRKQNNNNNNNSAGNRESKFTGKSIQVSTNNDLAPRERKTLVKGKSLSVIAKNKTTKSNKQFHKTINNSWIGPSHPTSPEPIPSASKKSLPAKVVISNLHPNVTQEDILELFGAIGPLRDGRLKSVGTADVVYRVAEDAFAAYSKYHGRNLDGQPMILKITTAEEEGSSSLLPSRSNKLGASSSSTPYYSTPPCSSSNNATAISGTPVVFTVKL